MKSLRVILLHTFTLYLLVLMVLPCSDVHAEQQNNATVSFSHNDTHDDEHNEKEVCTPFCICVGCVVAVVVQSPVEFIPLYSEIFSNKITNFYTSPQSNFYGSIWQPPQLV